MKLFKILIVGIFFGIVLSKAEIISWFRIYEMFRFESFHMYGVIGSAVVLGVIMHLFAKKGNWKSIEGKALNMKEYPKGWKNYLIGGVLFGCGWAMTGACPGPLFILVGNGFTVMLIAIAAALLGTFVYGLLKDKLPH